MLALLAHALLSGVFHGHCSPSYIVLFCRTAMMDFQIIAFPDNRPIFFMMIGTKQNGIHFFGTYLLSENMDASAKNE